jgi:hypothetical protein
MEVNMKKDLFKPSHFTAWASCQLDAIEISDMANDMLNALMESWPVVYWSHKESLIYRENIRDATHKSKLAFTEIIINNCKHEPIESVMTGHICTHCGVKLQATWTEKK